MKRLLLLFLVLASAAVGPNIFPAAQAGYGTLSALAIRLLIPSILLLAGLVFVLRQRDPALARTIAVSALAGALATIPLEIVRLTGFHFDYMPGNLPRLMGVLLLDRFSQGPSTASDLVGWAYHFWNGAAFGIIYAVIFGTNRRWVATLYGLAIGIGFMLSPVVKSLGVGPFGVEFSYGFPVTVIAAHIAFGVTLGWLTNRFLGAQSSQMVSSIRQCFGPRSASSCGCLPGTGS